MKTASTQKVPIKMCTSWLKIPSYFIACRSQVGGVTWRPNHAVQICINRYEQKNRIVSDERSFESSTSNTALSSESTVQPLAGRFLVLYLLTHTFIYYILTSHEVILSSVPIMYSNVFRFTETNAGTFHRCHSDICLTSTQCVSHQHMHNLWHHFPEPLTCI